MYRRRRTRYRAPRHETPDDASRIHEEDQSLRPPIQNVRDGVRQRRPDWTIRQWIQSFLRLLRETLTLLVSLFDSAGFGDNGHDVTDQLIVGGLGGKQLFDTGAARGGQARTRQDQWQRDLMLAEIESRRLARHCRVGGVIENIVRDLKGHAEQLPIARQRRTIARRATQCARLARRRK